MKSRRSASSSENRQAALLRILEEMNEKGQFETSVLVSADGLSLASVTSHFETETTAAMVILVKNVVSRAQTYIGLQQVDEVSIVDSDRIRLVCRPFTVGDEELVLTIVAPPYRTYRRLTNHAIREIKRVWF
ncbi:MAG: hypothetical protein SVX38_09820 [Chloroflexota bacterium]|nr:hypothetical protein [Chloroflexota bacterium]